ncbi:protein of unknown function [Streptomyces murinus]
MAGHRGGPVPPSVRGAGPVRCPGPRVCRALSPRRARWCPRGRCPAARSRCGPARRARRYAPPGPAGPGDGAPAPIPSRSAVCPASRSAARSRRVIHPLRTAAGGTGVSGPADLVWTIGSGYPPGVTRKREPRAAGRSGTAAATAAEGPAGPR